MIGADSRENTFDSLNPVDLLPIMSAHELALKIIV